MKQLFICKEHHNVLLPWAWVSQSNKELNLLTLDHHTDTHDAFLYYLHYNKNEDLNSLISGIDLSEDSTIINAIKKLRNDEQIDTAIKCGIFDKAFVVSYKGAFDQPCSNEFTNIHKSLETKIQLMMGEISLPAVQTYPDVSLYVIGTSSHLNDENGISDKFLEFALSKIKKMSNIDIFNTNFILDIDLDYFHSYESLNRPDIKLFQQLLSQATAITIATEPCYAYKEINPEKVLKRILTIAKTEIGNELKIVDLR